MKYDKQTRRYFLQGLGGSLMTLPILPSLMSSKAYAQAMAAQKFFIIIKGDQGGTGYNKDWYPAAVIDNLNSNAFSQQTLIPAGGQNDIPHILRTARLTSLLSRDPGHDGGNVDNNQQRLSYILGSFLNPYLNKMNMFAGIDGGMSYYGHSRAVHAGSIFSVETSPSWQTVDHFLANSPRFYLNRDVISTPVLHVSIDGHGSSFTRELNGFPLSGSLRQIYNDLFSRYDNNNQNPQAVAAEQRREFLIDRVLEDFNRLLNGSTGLARRISSSDKRKLANHAEHLYETQRKLRNVVNSCSDVRNPTSGEGVFHQYVDIDLQAVTDAWDNVTNLLVAAISCGATNIANLMGNIGRQLHAGDYHGDIVHQHSNSRTAQLTHNRNFRWQAQHIVGSLVRKLDGISVGNGQTLLDRGMVAFIHECGTHTHDHHNLGAVTFGSVDNFFNTGHFVDYRNMQNLSLLFDYNQPEIRVRPGVPIQRFYANVLQAYGHQPSDYRRNNRPGYGAFQDAPSYNGTRYNTARHVPYPREMVNSFDQLLPVIT